MVLERRQATLKAALILVGYHALEIYLAVIITKNHNFIVHTSQDRLLWVGGETINIISSLIHFISISPSNEQAADGKRHIDTARAVFLQFRKINLQLNEIILEILFREVNVIVLLVLLHGCETTFQNWEY